MKISFENHIIICGYYTVEKIENMVREIHASEKFSKSKFILVTDRLNELPSALVELDVAFVKGRPTDEEVLYRANILKCAGVIIIADNPLEIQSDDRVFTISSIVEMIGKENGKDIKTIVELTTEKNLKSMKRAQVDGIVSSEGVSSCLLVQEFLHPGVTRVISQILSNEIGSQLYLYETKLNNVRIIDVQKGVLSHEANIQIIGILKNGEYHLNPKPQMTITQGDVLIILAENLYDLGKIEKEINQKVK